MYNVSLFEKQLHLVCMNGYLNSGVHKTSVAVKVGAVAKGRALGPAVLDFATALDSLETKLAINGQCGFEAASLGKPPDGFGHRRIGLGREVVTPEPGMGGLLGRGGVIPRKRHSPWIRRWPFKVSRVRNIWPTAGAKEEGKPPLSPGRRGK